MNAIKTSKVLQTAQRWIESRDQIARPSQHAGLTAEAFRLVAP
jgi:hypothetical protein